MRSLLMSCTPQECCNILNGDCSLLIRKLKCKCELPIDVYIYCTKDKLGLYDNHEHITSASDKYFLDSFGYDKPPLLNGKVVAKFTLNKVEEIECWGEVSAHFSTKSLKESELEKQSCLCYSQLFDYLEPNASWEGYGDIQGYAWHIDNLVIFDKPKELSEFKHYSNILTICNIKTDRGFRPTLRPLTKAPKTFTYVEVE